MAEAVPMEEKSPLVFALNGKKVQLQNVDPSMTLLTYLRTRTQLKGTKYGCGEGGCGACVVLVSRFNSLSGKVEDYTVNSCLSLLCSLDGCAITTIEGLGNSSKGLHAIQKRIVGFHASQCGFCTPGMCMSIYGHLKKHGSKNSAETDCILAIPQSDVEKSITGNICRCTGYRPILDVCKTFGSDVDLEDLGLNIFWSDKKHANANLLPLYNPSKDPSFPSFLQKHLPPHPLMFSHVEGTKGCTWFRSSSLQDVSSALESYQGRKEVRYTVGNTSAGIYKNANPEVYVDVSHVPELLVLKHEKSGVEVGAAITFQKLIEFMKDFEAGTSFQGAANMEEQDKHPYHYIADHLEKVASSHVRNRASIGGNLIMAQRQSFNSDLATILLGAGALIKLVISGKQVVKTMDQFLEESLHPAALLQSVIIPDFLQESDSPVSATNGCNGTDMPLKFKTYRAASRHLANAIAHVNAAFLVQMTSACLDGYQHKVKVIKSSRLAFGVSGQQHAIRVNKVEKFLKGKIITASTILDSLNILKTDVAFEGIKLADYKCSTAAGFLFRFMSLLAIHGQSLSVPILDNQDYLKNSNEILDETLQDAGKRYNSGTLMSGKQELPSGSGSPTPKDFSEIQASGEAIYVDDIPSKNCLHAAFVYGGKAFAKIKTVILEPALSSPGVVSFVSINDIPENGKNVGCATIAGHDPLFATDSVCYVGHPLGLVVADTPQHAKAGAAKVEIEYETECMEQPILTIEDAISRGSYFEEWPFCKSQGQQRFGEVSEGFKKADHKIECAEVRTGSQYFFYLETQTALVVPDEDNCLVIYSSCQGPQFVQNSVSLCLGIPMHNIRVITRRVGGGFGGKAFVACRVAAACAVAARKLGCPVRLSLDRKTDMIMAGGRHMTKTQYTVAFTSTGKVTALQAKVFIQAGWPEDLSPAIPMFMRSVLKKYDWGSFDIDFKICRTNIPARTAMRAPGDTQGSFIADSILHHVAAFLNLEPSIVIERNLHTFERLEAFFGSNAVDGPINYTLPEIWRRLKANAGFEGRIDLVKAYNSSRRWSKRGISIVPCVYQVSMFPVPARVSILQDASVVVEVGGIELGQGLWTKVRQATLYALNEIWEEKGNANTLAIRVVQADSISLVNGGLTSGSTSSEGSCAAAMAACKILVERLKPIKQMLENANQNSISWESLITAAAMRNVDLAAQTYFAAQPNAVKYMNYGAAISEVEIDVLSGETTLLRTDILYDCGKSMNPAIDIGQIEGAFVQGIGFFATEEYGIDEHGRVTADGTWTYKPPIVGNLPQKLNIELFNSPGHEKRILSSKASGEPPLVLASTVYFAIRNAITAARQDLNAYATQKPSSADDFFQLDTPATMDKVRSLCGLTNVEQYLQAKILNDAVE